MKRTTKKNGVTKLMRKRAPAVLLHTPIELSEGMWDRITGKAYELWEERGHREGYDLEDWYDAEAIVLQEIHDSRE